MDQVVQVAGSLLVLAAFIASQRGRLSTDSLPYLMLNFIGAGILAVLAWLDRQYGFLLLEGSWSLVAAAGIIRRA